MEEENKTVVTQKKNIWGIVALLLVCLLVMGGTWYFSHNYLEVFPIDGSSMYPTINDSDFALIFKTKKLKYDDVFIFYRSEEDKFLVKRVIGLAGDKIDITYSDEDGLYHVYRNGKKLSEDYINEPIDNSNNTYFNLSVTVPENKIFYLGDNRMHSTDSHYGYYYADIENIQGKVILKYKGWKIKFL